MPAVGYERVPFVWKVTRQSAIRIERNTTVQGSPSNPLPQNQGLYLVTPGFCDLFTVVLGPVENQQMRVPEGNSIPVQQMVYRINSSYMLLIFHSPHGPSLSDDDTVDPALQKRPSEGNEPERQPRHRRLLDPTDTVLGAINAAQSAAFLGAFLEHESALEVLDTAPLCWVRHTIYTESEKVMDHQIWKIGCGVEPNGGTLETGCGV
ncbi:hypothetical protein FB45DRAFT_866626 [Roridomyces roridus]|uniref:Uncharacterized protein n=1 Tax=Roridomyces roridus TaxID=1738132 RepID=A0AAD7BXP8_9AGAR|nr:hypothetical protein FB45DRAFT_866626 [Roridomyces roridus]